MQDGDLEVDNRSISVGEQKVILTTELGMVVISTFSCLVHDWMLNLKSDARHILVISEAALQYQFYDISSDGLEVVNSFVLLVATKNKCQDVLEKLVGDVAAMGFQLEAPAAGVTLTSSIQTLAGNLASSLIGATVSLAVTESKAPHPTLLQWALVEGIETLVEILVAMKGAVITANSLRFRQLLHDAVRSGHRPTMILVVSRHGMQADMSAREHGHTALQVAAKEGSLSAISVLLEAGVDVNAAPAYHRGHTALQAAAGGGHLVALGMLLKAGADVNAAPAEFGGHTALQAAAGGGHLVALDMLLEAGADVNAAPAEEGGHTALQAAAGGGHHVALDMLLKAGAKVNAALAYHGGHTALQAAAGGGHLVALEMLLKAGADVNAAPALEGGHTALQAAAGGGHHVVLSMLREAGAV